MTTLVRQPPLPEFDAMERRFRRLLEGTIPLLPAFVSPLAPAADVYETAEEYVVELEVPGYEETELTLEVSDHTLVVTGVREEAKGGPETSYRLRERLERAFERTFSLPPDFDSAQVMATFDKGVLRVSAPKLETAKPRTIAISKS